jgi:hypothetical protein
MVQFECTLESSPSNAKPSRQIDWVKVMHKRFGDDEVTNLID